MLWQGDQSMSATLSFWNCGNVSEGLKKQALEGFERGDVVRMLISVGIENALWFVCLNAQSLIDRGVYEECLLDAFTGTRTNNRHWDEEVLGRMFERADREKLLAAGDSLPDGDSFTVYRGVSGVGKQRRLRGWSWTVDQEKAEWFANRLCLRHPAVLRATVRRDEVFAYYDGKGEQEFICQPERFERIKLSAAVALES
jgi:hypothetical protein